MTKRQRRDDSGPSLQSNIRWKQVTCTPNLEGFSVRGSILTENGSEELKLVGQKPPLPSTTLRTTQFLMSFKRGSSQTKQVSRSLSLWNVSAQKGSRFAYSLSTCTVSSMNPPTLPSESGIGNLKAIFGPWETYRRGRGLSIPSCSGLHRRGEAATRARLALIHP